MRCFRFFFGFTSRLIAAEVPTACRVRVGTNGGFSQTVPVCARIRVRRGDYVPQCSARTAAPTTLQHAPGFFVPRPAHQCCAFAGKELARGIFHDVLHIAVGESKHIQFGKTNKQMPTHMQCLTTLLTTRNVFATPIVLKLVAARGHVRRMIPLERIGRMAFYPTQVRVDRLSWVPTRGVARNVRDARGRLLRLQVDACTSRRNVHGHSTCPTWYGEAYRTDTNETRRMSWQCGSSATHGIDGTRAHSTRACGDARISS